MVRRSPPRLTQARRHARHGGGGNVRPASDRPEHEAVGEAAAKRDVVRQDADPAAAPPGRVLAPPQFWALMERWQVPDPLALELIAFAGKRPPSGKRPRFRFDPRQQRVTHYLAEVEAALEALDYDRGWLHQPNHADPFAGRPPLEAMRHDGLSGNAAVLGWLHREAMRRMLAG